MGGLNLVLTEKALDHWLDPQDAARTVLLTPSSLLDRAESKARKAFAGWYTTPDYYGTITELIAAEVVLDLSIDRVGSLGEFDVLRAARLRDLTGMVGQGFQAALRFRDKWLMKSIAGEAGIAVPRMVLVEGVGTLPHRIGEIGLPAVVKPRWMAAAGIGVKLVRDFSHCSEIMQLLSGHVRPFELMVEEYVESPLWHVDGLMLDGAVTAAVASEFTDVAGQAAGSAVLDEDDPRGEVLLAAAAKVVAALGSPPHTQAFHAEFFLGAEGVPMLCEIATRTGGLGIPAMVEAVTGINLRRESLLGQLGLEPAPLSPRKSISSGYLAMPAGSGKPAAAPESIPFEWVVQQAIRNRSGSGIVMQATVIGATRLEVRSRLAELASWWEGRC
ncbi:MAG TPA: hypothetical protein VF062_22595 [Candidatus Limnocylindrales bacterium]